ncbi:hypothetical protein TSUD_228980 [Trifolium subterraneum]|uniref:Uncharacterized protein n=1 Tax=Trifolium subterraneum TaxID=3900 RepID=A0A2Z6M9A9_TRISU|nr:hypothetical protein TSUD_228980 [Trifolium subterraneum]
MQMGLDPVTHRPRTDHLDLLSNLQQIILNAANIPNLQNFEAPLQQFLPQECEYSKKFDEQIGNTNVDFAISTNSLPKLVSVSPQRLATVKVREEDMVINEKECCNTSSTNFETWGDFMNEDANDAYWKDFIE